VKLSRGYDHKAGQGFGLNSQIDPGASSLIVASADALSAMLGSMILRLGFAFHYCIPPEVDGWKMVPRI
jgi:hypothetical protein